MSVTMEPIGFVQTEAQNVPRHWSVSDVEGVLIIDDKYRQGLKDVKAGQRIVVIFHFHRSQKFTSSFLTQTPPHRGRNLGVFSICSPIRPNPIGMSILDVVGIQGNRISVKGLDMEDGTPILDIKPYIQDKYSCPSFEGQRRPTTP
ncbi:MAG: tRNA-Thr(GGU) m(6)t(6)A37 methyltransferase TsaA [Nitrospira bacterium SG8_3]|nr:MAG: tRNA-Thr(GGU) m(6)t(6)A37 methyltransferase TsaA [Nitrospira bacterium SG8_3]